MEIEVGKKRNFSLAGLPVAFERSILSNRTIFWEPIFDIPRCLLLKKCFLWSTWTKSFETLDCLERVVLFYCNRMKVSAAWCSGWMKCVGKFLWRLHFWYSIDHMIWYFITVHLNPCQNGGIFVRTAHDYFCICHREFRGKNCKGRETVKSSEPLRYFLDLIFMFLLRRTYSGSRTDHIPKKKNIYIYISTRANATSHMLTSQALVFIFG